MTAVKTISMESLKGYYTLVISGLVFSGTGH